MSLSKSLFKQTAIYGLATVLPRMLSFLLVRLYTDIMPKAEYGSITIVLSWMVFFNVILSYGMETSFFRFYNKEDDKKSVVQTTTISIFWSSILFLIFALLARHSLAELAQTSAIYISMAICILVLDALAIVPFSKLRVEQKPIKFAFIKIGNVVINLFLNFFFLLLLPKLATNYPSSFFNFIYIENFQVGYIFMANLLASLLTLLVFMPSYFQLKWQFNKQLWQQMLNYGWPILFAGLAFGINEHFDKILLGRLLPENIAKSEVGTYAACYKLGLFMVLFRTAFTLGIEPFFFSHAKNENAPQTYAAITKYFVIFGSIILLVVIVFAELLKQILIPNPEYWAAMKVVPLIILANFCLGIYTSLSVWYKLIDKTKIGAYISIIGATITLIINYLLIPHYSYMGSAIATLAAYGTMMSISYFLGQKKYPIPYDIPRISGYLIMSITLSGLVFYVPFLRQNFIFGVLSILIFGYFVYYNEKDFLLKILKRK